MDASTAYNVLTIDEKKALNIVLVLFALLDVATEPDLKGRDKLECYAEMEGLIFASCRYLVDPENNDDSAGQRLAEISIGLKPNTDAIRAALHREEPADDQP